VKRAAVRVRTHAKINLFLRVHGRRRDGYHDIQTVFHGISLADDMEFANGKRGEIDVQMTLARNLLGELPSREDNLVVRAAQLLACECRERSGARIKVTKRIPIGAGLAGGSADAAGALVGLNRLWAVGLDGEALVRLGRRLGSDVPYCVVGGTVFATGRGEVLAPLAAPTRMWFVLAVSGNPLSTRRVYEAWDEYPGTGPDDGSLLKGALSTGDVAGVASALRNDLETAAFRLRPELAAKKDLLYDSGALGACLTGSGPALIAVANSEAHARDLAGRVSDHFDFVEVVASQNGGVERLD
jgi:4-diphosphocytidyl-2-C-methyl-D-erythritol kinase